MGVRLVNLEPGYGLGNNTNTCFNHARFEGRKSRAECSSNPPPVDHDLRTLVALRVGRPHTDNASKT
eukprot:15108555-Alexandrium_andersonii.AAC.1